jgi:hypothetical protein
MRAAKRAERTGAPLNVGHDRHRPDLTGAGVGQELGQPDTACRLFGLGDSGLDRGDGVVLVRRQR